MKKIFQNAILLSASRLIGLPMAEALFRFWLPASASNKLPIIRIRYAYRDFLEKETAIRGIPAKDLLIPCDYHLNSQGHKIAAEVLEAELRPLLEK